MKKKVKFGPKTQPGCQEVLDTHPSTETKITMLEFMGIMIDNE